MVSATLLTGHTGAPLTSQAHHHPRGFEFHAFALGAEAHVHSPTTRGTMKAKECHKIVQLDRCHSFCRLLTEWRHPLE